MTDFLYLNEVSIPVAYAQATQANQEHGAYFGRSMDGTGRRTSRAQKRVWSVATPPLDLADADVLEGLVLGKGHHWPFDTHFYSSKGLGPDAGYSSGTVIGTTTPSPSVGAGYLEVPSAGTIAFDVGFTSDWTWMAAVSLNGAAWKHRAYVYDASTATLTQYEDAVSGTYGTGIYTMTAGVLTLKGRNLADDGNQANQFDDLVVLPFKASAALVTAHKTSVLAATGRPFSSLPALRVTGNIVDLDSTATTPIECHGLLRGQSFSVSSTTGSVWSDQRRSVAFDLVEV